MEDIAPALLESIRKDFKKILGDAKLEKPDYIGAAEYAEAVGDALAKAFRMNISADRLPEGRLFWNIADRVVRPMLELDHNMVADATCRAQKALNMKAGLGLNPIKPPVNNDKVDGLLNKVAEAEDYDSVAWVLDEPVRTYSRGIVDEVLERNIDFQGRAGLHPKVIRTAESHCCEWCSKLAGVYEYPDVPHEVYQRHEHCRCTVEYDPGDRRQRQNVWTKVWK